MELHYILESVLSITVLTLKIIKTFGFNEQERKILLDYAQINSFLIWEIAREDGGKIAASL